MRIKSLLGVGAMLAACGGGGTGTKFESEARGWQVPSGGDPAWGYWNTSDSDYSETGHDNFATIDMNGDKRPDLVVFSKTEATTVKAFDAKNGLAWKVFLNNGNSFDKAAIAWTIPEGGDNEWGFFSSAGFNAQVAGNDNWFLADVTGDRKPDLVIASETVDAQGTIRPFDANAGQAWKVYKNNGKGFDTKATAWALPEGGHPERGFYWAGATDTQTENHENWTLIDLTGDRRPDLLVTSTTRSNGFVEVAGTDKGNAWRLYKNTGNGFEKKATSFSVPEGGNTEWGFWNTSEFSGANGHENYGLLDLNGDNRPDLVVPSIQRQGSIDTFSTDTGEAWKVYYNNGSGFDSASKLWKIPAGGNPQYGFYTFNEGASSDGADSYGTLDLNGDKIPDLVLTSEIRGSDVTTFSDAEGGKVWRIFLGESNGFAAEPVTWPIPGGGDPEWGFYAFSDMSTSEAGQDNFQLLDMNGDERPDLLLTSRTETEPRLYGLTDGSGWRIYLNN